MSQHFICKEEKTIVSDRKISDITGVKFLNPTQRLSSLKCNACKNQIGKKRPIALAWAENKPWRLCNACCGHMEEC